ncbi:isopentenyl-diphosphate Delta-isomerase [Pedobacter gandavensis]|uniref:isopentenyl-diphosphate Delta-isomerase n=1 Tax=Pedobacter gandavensis TaxID=2679963 RepID=UPI00247A9CD5|nr:isopentenyl-diphosphate Delta-isomerase [Pedobacter gandavensis]WGQ09752.1 isopentenyl-diphosphate Delta-isomerase [Pedobacter gandavensis]
MKNRNKVVLVDQHDKTIGEMDKIEAHQKGFLHRAFSIFLFNNKGEMLIHQRAKHKYHGAGLWTNACCSHPQLGEDIKLSAMERLQFEMGIQCNIEKVFSFIYNTSVENNLIEHEFDHVFIGYTDAIPRPNAKEVQTFKWIDTTILSKDIQEHPDQYTYWFKMVFSNILDYLNPDVKL